MNNRTKNFLLIPYGLTFAILSCIYGYNIIMNSSVNGFSLSLLYRIIIAIFGIIYIVAAMEIDTLKDRLSNFYKWSIPFFVLSYIIFLITFIILVIFAPSTNTMILALPLMTPFISNQFFTNKQTIL